MKQRILVLADSLAFHGPDRAYVLTDERLWPNVMAANAVPGGAEIALQARLGWTVRDAWWAVTKDPNVWGVELPRADALVLAVGGMDSLPAAIPTYLREGIPFVRPASARRHVRAIYRAMSPHVMRLTAGRLRQLPQAATDHYLSRIVSVARHFHPDLPIVLIAPGVHASAAYPSHRHESALAAAIAWAERSGAEIVIIDDMITPSLLDGSANPDGIHYSWATHQLIGQAAAQALARAGASVRT